MEKLKLGEIGERLKTGGAQITRKVSGKMKEILHNSTQSLSPATPESRLVDDATSDRLEESDWAMNLRICSLLNAGEISGQEVVRAIKKRIVPSSKTTKSPKSQKLSLDLLEVCAMNCEKIFSEVASERVLDEMVKMIDCAETDIGNRRRALELIQAWGESREELGYLPTFSQTYESLKARGVKFMNEDDDDMAQSFPSLEEQNFDPLSDSDPVVDLRHTSERRSGNDMPADSGGTIYTTIQAKEAFDLARNNIELFSALLNANTQQEIAADDPIVPVAAKSKQLQGSLQRMIQRTSDGEVLLFEALHLHDELQTLISRYEELILVQNEKPESKSGIKQQLDASHAATRKQDEEGELGEAEVGTSEPGNYHVEK